MTAQGLRRAGTSAAIAAVALAGALLPVTPAHATYGPPQPVYLQVNSTSGTALANAQGTVAFDDGNTRYTYSVNVCWQHAYPAPYLYVYVNGARAYGSEVGGPATTGCQSVRVFSANDVNHGAVVANIRFDLTAGWFDGPNGYKQKTRSFTYDNPYN